MIIEKLYYIKQKEEKTSTQWILADYFLHHKHEEMNLEIVAEETCVSKSTIQRFVKDLGYFSFNSFVKNLRTSSSNRVANRINYRNLNCSFNEYLKRVKNEQYDMFVHQAVNKMRMYHKIRFLGDFCDLEVISPYLSFLSDFDIEADICCDPFLADQILKSKPVEDAFTIFVMPSKSFTSFIDSLYDEQIIENIQAMMKKDYAVISTSSTPRPIYICTSCEGYRYSTGIYERTLVSNLMCDILDLLNKQVK